MVQGGMKCIKYLLFFFNFVFVILGIVLLAVGISTKTGFSKHLSFIDPQVLNYPPNLFIAAGAIIFIIAFLGCYGSWRESHCMMITYSVLLGLLLVLELAAAFSAFALKDDVEHIFKTGLEDSQTKYQYNSTEDSVKEITKGWDVMQNEWKCCGTSNYTDWINNTHLAYVPDSCCIVEHEGCAADNKIKADTSLEKAKEFIHTEGCWDHALKELTLETIGITGIILAAVELLGIISACLMARSIRYSYETV